MGLLMVGGYRWADHISNRVPGFTERWLTKKHGNLFHISFISRRIHGAGIYANIWGILMGSMLPYIAYMDPMGI